MSTHISQKVGHVKCFNILNPCANTDVSDISQPWSNTYKRNAIVSDGNVLCKGLWVEARNASKKEGVHLS